MIDRSVRVWWPDDQCFYEGTISSFDESSKRYKVVYDDEFWEFVRLSVEAMEIEHREGEGEGAPLQFIAAPVPVEEPEEESEGELSGKEEEEKKVVKGKTAKRSASRQHVRRKTVISDEGSEDMGDQDDVDVEVDTKGGMKGGDDEKDGGVEVEEPLSEDIDQEPNLNDLKKGSPHLSKSSKKRARDSSKPKQKEGSDEGPTAASNNEADNSEDDDWLEDEKPAPKRDKKSSKCNLHP